MTLIKVNNATKHFVNPLWNNVFNDFFNNQFNGQEQASHVPSVNILEDDAFFEIHLSAPGFSKESFKIEVSENLLSIQGDSKIESGDEKSGRKYTRKEFSIGSFKRSWTLPKQIDVDAIKAKYENGILLVSIPKRLEDSKATTREVKIG